MLSALRSAEFLLYLVQGQVLIDILSFLLGLPGAFASGYHLAPH